MHAVAVLQTLLRFAKAKNTTKGQKLLFDENQV
jgi:hypothetical protein